MKLQFKGSDAPGTWTARDYVIIMELERDALGAQSLRIYPKHQQQASSQCHGGIPYGVLTSVRTDGNEGHILINYCRKSG